MKWKATVEELSESKVILSVDDDAAECGDVRLLLSVRLSAAVG